MLKFTSDVLPEAVPEEVIPLNGTEDFTVEQATSFQEFLSLQGRNVFVDLKDETVHVGLLHSVNGGEFQVGTKSGVISYKNVRRYREV